MLYEICYKSAILMFGMKITRQNEKITDIKLQRRITTVNRHYNSKYNILVFYYIISYLQFEQRE